MVVTTLAQKVDMIVLGSGYARSEVKESVRRTTEAMISNSPRGWQPSCLIHSTSKRVTPYLLLRHPMASAQQ